MSADLTFSELINAVWKHWKTVAAITTAGLLAAAAFAFVQTPIYQGQAVVIPVEADKLGSGDAALSQFAGLASLVGIDFGRATNKREAIELIRSKGFASRFISDENLMPVLFAESWDADLGRWHSQDAPTLNDAVRLFDRKIRGVSEDNRTGIVRISILWKDPEEAARWANKLVERLNDELRSRSIAESERTLKYLNEEAAKTNVLEVREAIYHLVENEIKSVTFANARPDYALRIIDRATAADADDFVKPRRLLIAALGAVAGFLVAMGLIVIRLSVAKN